MINVGVNLLSSRKAVKIADKYDNGVWAAVGMHPECLGDKKTGKDENVQEPEFDVAAYRELAKSSKKVVAIGETGLDYLRLPKNDAKATAIKEKQAKIFQQQLALARELDLPVIIHSRLAHEDLIKILQKEAAKKGEIKGVVHCFTGTSADARQYFDLGLYFGLNGIIFKLKQDNIIARLPLERILLETDCPYLSPLPEIKRNEPRYVIEVAKRVAQIRNDSVDTIIESSFANAKKLFGI